VSSFKIKLIKFFTFIGGIYFFLEFLLPVEYLNTEFGFKFDKYHDQITDGIRTIGSMACGLGILNILFVHSSKVIFKKKNFIYSFVLLVSLFLMLTISITDWVASERYAQRIDKFNKLISFSNHIQKGEIENYNQEQRNGLLKAEFLKELKENQKFIISKGTDNYFQDIENKITLIAPNSKDFHTQIQKEITELIPILRESYNTEYETLTIRNSYRFLYEGLFIALGSAMFSLLGFYMAVAAYRAFKIKSFESALMVLTAITVMLGQISFGEMLWGEFKHLRIWILSNPNSAAFRAIVLGAEVGALVMAFRMWFSIESETFGAKK